MHSYAGFIETKLRIRLVGKLPSVCELKAVYIGTMNTVLVSFKLIEQLYIYFRYIQCDSPYMRVFLTKRNL